MVVEYRLIGTGTTDEYGVAHMTKDAQGQTISGYTGTGKGLVQVVASTSQDPTAQGSLVSETYSIMDTFFYDNGLDDSKESNWINTDTTNQSVTYSDNGTKIENTSSSVSAYYTCKINNTHYWRDSSKNYCIEAYISFEKSGSGASSVVFGGASIPIWGLKTGDSGSFQLKLITDGTSLKPYVDGTHISNQDKTMSNDIGIQFSNYRTASITFKNLRIYYI